MLGQTIALGMNLRLANAQLGNLVLGGTYIVTMASTGCDENATPIPGTQGSFSVPQAVIDALHTLYGSNGATVAHLFDLANHALCGGATGGASLGQIHDAVGAINEGLDECKFVVGTSNTPIGKLLVLKDVYETPTEYALSVNYPNPFNPSTTIRYGLLHTSFVSLTVYNTLGQQIAQLVNEQQQAGYHDVVFRGDGVASGVYFYRIQAGDFVASKKLLLLK
jgi:hypothetical protein